MSDLGLAVRQVRYTNKAFWRNPASVFFTFAFPLMFLVIFTALFGNNTQQIFGRQVSTSTFYVASIAAFSIITATYTNLAISVTFQRDAGILKRTRGTPLPSWAYLFGRIVHAVIVAIILVAIVAAFGAASDDLDGPAAERETLAAARRAGAGLVISYGARSVTD